MEFQNFWLFSRSWVPTAPSLAFSGKESSCLFPCSARCCLRVSVLLPYLAISAYLQAASWCCLFLARGKLFYFAIQHWHPVLSVKDWGRAPLLQKTCFYSKISPLYRNTPSKCGYILALLNRIYLVLIRLIQGLLYHTPAEKTVESVPNFCFLITAVFIPAFFIGLPNPCRQANEKKKPLKWSFDSIFGLDGQAGCVLEDFFSVINLHFRTSSKCSQNPPFIICAKLEKSSPSSERMECSPNARNSSFLLPCNL